jgi:aspartyl-tRNA(Asn)/glutamyl-tRNA(Gln) amidotransferase subunit C
MIDSKTVDYVANLSRIRLDDEQSEIMQKELGKILDYMEILQSVDTSGIEPLSHVFSVTNVTRPDEAGEHFERELLLANAPDSTHEAFVVPKAVDA